MNIKSTLEYFISHDMADMWMVLNTDERRIVAENLNIRNYRKNQIVYAENDKPEYLFILLQGKVKKYKLGIGERVQILKLYRPVQYFGYRAYFASEHYGSTCASFESSIIASIRLDIVDKLLHQNILLARFFIRELSRDLGGSNTKIVNLTQKHIRGRLAESLLILMENYGFENDGATLNICLSREDLANLSNMTTSNAIRTLTSFVEERLILVDGRRIKIIDEPQLRTISKFG